MDRHLTWLLSLATTVHHKFMNSNVEQLVKSYIVEHAKTNPHETIIITNTMLNDSAPLLVLSNNASKMFDSIIESIKTNRDSIDMSIFKPTTIITKLSDLEYIFDVAGSRIVYAINVSSSPIDNLHIDISLVRSMMCKQMSSLKYYFKHINKDSNQILASSINELSYDLEHSIIKGGKKKVHKKNTKAAKPQSDRSSVKTIIIKRMIEYVKINTICMDSLIYVTGIDQIDNHAMDIIFSDYRVKDCIIDYFKLIIKEQFKDYKFEMNPHKQFNVPGDYRLTKFSCMIKNKKTNQVSYLVNLYNNAIYDPIPCYRMNVPSTLKHDSEKQNGSYLKAHPLVHLRYLYLDKYFLNIKGSTPSTDKFNSIVQSMIDSTFDDLNIVTNKVPIWIGTHRDENFDKNQENMKSNTESYNTVEF